VTEAHHNTLFFSFSKSSVFFLFLGKYVIRFKLLQNYITFDTLSGKVVCWFFCKFTFEFIHRSHGI